MHKVFIYVDSADVAGQSNVVSGVSEVLAVYGLRVLAKATDDQSTTLINDGFRVELADQPDQLELNNVIIDTTVAAPVTPVGWSISEDTRCWLVQFVGTPKPEWIQDVENKGVEVLAPASHYSIFVRMNSAQAGEVETIPQVQWLGPYEAPYKITPELAGQTMSVPAAEMQRLVNADGSSNGTFSEQVNVRVSMFEGISINDVNTIITVAGGTIDQSGSGVVICTIPRSAIKSIALVSDVSGIDVYLPPEIELQRARPLTTVQYSFDAHGLDGKGEVIGIADTGLDVGTDNETIHADFKQSDGVSTGRIKRGYDLGGKGGWNDVSSHGTHVAGIAAGNGRASGLLNSGIARQAEIVMQSTSNGAGGLTIPVNLNDLFTPVYDNDGVRVHNNSWGTPTGPGVIKAYSENSRQVDQFVWRNPDMIIVFSAGNSGVENDADGEVEFYSLGEEKNFRNGITVGASENNRPEIAILNYPGDPTNYPAQWGRRGLTSDAKFPTEPLKSDPISDNPTHMGPFSSRGPTSVASGSRTKPDVVAPGVSIFAALSSQWVIGPSISPYVSGPFNPAIPYVYKTGTSMAAPHVTGVCALIRQYLREVHGISDANNPDRRRRRPSAALIKGFLVHGARFIQGVYPAPHHAIDNTGPVQGNHQGWGRVDLQRTLFSNPPNNPIYISAADNAWLPRRTIFVDDPDITLNAQPAPAPLTGRQRDFKVTISNPTVPLRATLVWTDYPGPIGVVSPPHTGAVLNQLELSIIRASDNKIYNLSDPPNLSPAPAIPPPPAPAPPPVALGNNIQQIDVATAGVDALQADDYIIRVQAHSISSVTKLADGSLIGEEQDFTLVISGPISHSDHQNPGRMVALPDLAFIDLQSPVGGPIMHDGLSPSPVKPAGNLGSPDIWVSQNADPNQANAINDLEAGQTYYIHARVHNLGFADANDAQLQLFWADMTGPMSYPVNWKSDGFDLGNIPANQDKINVGQRSSVVAGPYQWVVPTGHEQLRIFARVNHPDDPVRDENNLRMDNNITSRDVFVKDNTTHIQGEPSGLSKAWFWIISGFGSPRDIEARWLVSYEDVRDGKIKPAPAGVEVEIWDQDPVTGDDKVATGKTVNSFDSNGNPVSALHLIFSTFESGERKPDLYCKVLSPVGDEYEEFRQNSYFINGDSEWISSSQTDADGGFFADDFEDSSLGTVAPIAMVIKPEGIRVHAVFESLSIISESFEPFPADIPVQILDSKVSAPQPVLANVTTDENGEIRAVLKQQPDYEPSIYFSIKEDDAVNSFMFIPYFLDQDSWESKSSQAEIIAPDGGVSEKSGHFENVNAQSLIAEGELLRFRLGPPAILMHLRFEYYDREKGGFASFPEDISLEVWEDDPAATSPVVIGHIGSDGRAELSVPKGSKNKMNLFVRIAMKGEWEREAISASDVEIISGGKTVSWDTKGQNAVSGEAGLFIDVETEVGTANNPLVFQMGSAADATVEHAAPFILKVLRELHDWIRIRTASDFQGFTSLQVKLTNNAAEGSKFETGLPDIIYLNTAHTAHNNVHIDTANKEPDQWNRLAIAHQYGHLVLDYLCGILNPPASIANHKAYNSEKQCSANLNGRRQAFAEGFADYIAFGHLVQKAKPDSDIPVLGLWSQPGIGNLFTEIAGEQTDDSTYIESDTNPAQDLYEAKLSVMTDPRTNAVHVPFQPFRASGYLVRYRIRNTKPAQTVNLTVKVMDAANEIASWSQISSLDEWTTFSRTLTPEQADSITGAHYNDVRLKFIADGGSGADRQLQVSWAEFELPHPARPDRDVNQFGWRGDDNDGSNSSGEIVPMAIANALWHLDKTIVGWGHAGIEDAVNQRRFMTMIWNAVKSLNTENNQVAYHFYRAIQNAILENEDWIDGDMLKTIQEVRRVFEANGMVFIRGQIHATPTRISANPRVMRFQLKTAEMGKLNVAEMGRIRAYKVDAARVGSSDFVELDSFALLPDELFELPDKLFEALSGAILFDAGKADIKPEFHAMLDEVAKVMKETASLAKIRIEGHTDSSGSKAANQTLSLNRAKAVEDYLVAQGIDRALLESAGYSEGLPVAVNASEADKAKNRRAVFNTTSCIIDLNLTEARQTGALASGDHDFRVRVMDEFGAWDTFADNFDTNAAVGVPDNNKWQRDRLRCIRPLTGKAVINVP